MKIKILCKFCLRLAVIVIISLLFTYYILPNNPSSIKAEEIKGSKNVEIIDTAAKKGSEEYNYKFIILVYTVALSILGLFNMFNALKIYEKKEQIDKEVNHSLERLKEDINNMNLREQGAKLDYKEMQFDIKKLSLELELQTKQLSSHISDISDEKISMIENKVLKMISDIEKTIDEAKNSFDSYTKTTTLLFFRHYYTYTINTIVPHYLGTENNIISVESALFWLSQHGDYKDIEMLNDKRELIKDKHKELCEVFTKTIKEIKQRSYVVHI